MQVKLHNYFIRKTYTPLQFIHFMHAVTFRTVFDKQFFRSNIYIYESCASVVGIYIHICDTQYIFDVILVCQIWPPQTEFMSTPMTSSGCLYPISYS